MVPWGVALLLAAIFSGGLKSLFTKIVETLGRVKSLSAGGAAIELHSQEIAGANITNDPSQLIRQYIQELSPEVNKETLNLASHFFLRYVSTTIYGSQLRLLEAIEKPPLMSSQAVVYYNQFIASAPELTEYKFESWMEFLTNNMLIQFDASNSNYTITNAGRLFLRETKKANLKAESFKY